MENLRITRTVYTEKGTITMTKNEAILRIKDHMEIHRLKEPRAIYITAALSMAITALKEIQQYLEIGTVEECREAVEKQKAKILEFYGSREDGKLLCQNCGEDLWDLRECGFNNCPYCGQAILWENLEGMEDE